MTIYAFDTDKHFVFLGAGKFQSPTPSWMHYRRKLLEFEFMLVTDGVLYIADHNNRYEVSKGEYILMAPTDNQHGYRASSCSFYWMHFSYNNNQNNPLICNDIEQLDLQPKELIIPKKELLSSYERVIILMKQLLDSDKRYRESILNKYLTSAILAETANQSTLFRKLSKVNSGDQLFNDIYEYILMHASENITVNSLAEYFNYSPTYLTSFFRRHSGLTIKQFMLQAKMEIAKAELTDSNHSVTQIAYNVGFDDVHNFSNAFKKVVGLSPTVYRNTFAKRHLNNT
ncbi:MAG: helix-turn-helix transcriptional regulator [Clostridiales bacterium]|nr:helix-turn-helix transcriptional regulator [Clostridiales bacterium]